MINSGGEPRHWCRKQHCASNILSHNEWFAVRSCQKVEKVPNYLGISFAIPQWLRLLDFNINTILVGSFRSKYDIGRHPANDFKHEFWVQIPSAVVFNYLITIFTD